MTGAELRSKDLVSLDLRRSSVGKASQNKNDGHDVRFLCHVSGDEITTQEVLLIKPTGCIILEPVARKLKVLEEKRCPVTGAAFRDKDVVKLKSGVSGYAGSGGAALQVKVHRAQGAGPKVTIAWLSRLPLPQLRRAATARALSKFKAGSAAALSRQKRCPIARAAP